MRRKPSALLPIELSILASAVELARLGTSEFYGYAMAKEIRDREAARRLTGHGTLYRALDRLAKLGLIESRWEDPEVAALDDRPRRRLYRVTALGERALADGRVPDAAAAKPSTRPGLVPS
ncbi:MAG: PadR family transcriptional regulator [Chloroflexota bacterium]|nr:PadR family transcriptional regulator [Chloroflexota bacterium]